MKKALTNEYWQLKRWGQLFKHKFFPSPAGTLIKLNPKLLS